MRSPGPPRGILRPHPPAGRFEHARVAPSDAALAEHVAHFWWVAWDLRGEPPFTAETLPHPTVHVVIEPRRARIIGVPHGAFRRVLRGQGHVFGIKFRPATFQPWLGGSMRQLAGADRPLAALLGTGARRLTWAVREAPTLGAAIELATPVLRARMPALPSDVIALRDLVEHMARDPEITRVEHAAARLGTDVRTLQRHCARFVGVTPKWIVQRYRLHEAAARLTSDPPPSLAALAHALGYFDQAHFARDFKAVLGAAPSAYVARRRAPTR